MAVDKMDGLMGLKESRPTSFEAIQAQDRCGRYDEGQQVCRIEDHFTAEAICSEALGRIICGVRGSSSVVQKNENESSLLEKIGMGLITIGLFIVIGRFFMTACTEAGTNGIFPGYLDPLGRIPKRT